MKRLNIPRLNGFSLHPTPVEPQHFGVHQALNIFYRYLLERSRGAARKPTNLSKVGTVIQGPQESLAALSVYKTLVAPTLLLTLRLQKISGPSIWLLFPSQP
ncbi:hypothetical protein AAY473_004792 [Plecturocebus cupreus]